MGTFHLEPNLRLLCAVCPLPTRRYCLLIKHKSNKLRLTNIGLPVIIIIIIIIIINVRSQRTRDLRRGSATACLLVLWVRIPLQAWMSVSCECCVLSSRGLCIGLITRPEESYWVWCVWVWSWSLENEEFLAHYELLRQLKLLLLLLLLRLLLAFSPSLVL